MSRLTVADRKRIAEAKVAFKVSIEKHAAALQPGEVEFEIDNFASWVKASETDSQTSVAALVDYMYPVIQSTAPTQCDSLACALTERSRRHYEIRKHFFDYAQAALARRFGAVEVQA